MLQIHDVAEFLGGELKTKNQHILVIYKKICKQTPSNQSVTIPWSENNSSSRLALQASILSASPVLRLEAVERGGGKSPVLHPKTSMARVESQPTTTQHLTVQANRLHLSASDPDLRNLKHGYGELHSGSTGNMKANPGSPISRRPLPPPPPGHESQVTQSNSRLRTGSTEQTQRKRPSSPRLQKRRNSDKDHYDLNCSSSSGELEFSHPPSNSFHRQRSADFSGQYRAPSPSDRSRHRSDSNGSMESLGDLDYNSDDDGNGSATKKVEITELNLYFLTENSPMFMHLRSTWNSCILVSSFFLFCTWYLVHV